MSTEHVDKLAKIGNTPLSRYEGFVPKGCSIHIKEERLNPVGYSHYDRVYKALIENFESTGKLRPGDTVVETTSGTAGISCAAICEIRGYKCKIIIPAGGEKAREDAIRAHGAEIIFSSAEAYVAGLPMRAKRHLAKNRHEVFLNHSRGEDGGENRTAVAALAEIGRELLGQLDPIDVAIFAGGNGSSILGPGRILRPKSRIVVFEPFQSALAFGMLYGAGEYQRRYHIKPGHLPRHNLPGTSYQGIYAPHLSIAFRDGLVDEVFLVSDRTTDEHYLRAAYRKIPPEIPRWDAIKLSGYGRTTLAGVAVALKIAERERDKNIVLIAYDKDDRYDT